jgi:hypothetical protein
MIDPNDPAGARPFIHVPVTTQEFEPSKPVELLLLAKAFIKAYYGELRPFWASMAGEGGPITHNPKGDEWKQTFMAKQLAAANDDFTALADLSDDAFRLVLRRAYRSHTKTAVGALITQGTRLRIEDLRAKKDAAKEAAE